MATLIASYQKALDTIVAEIAASGDGDEILLNVYILEPGASSERVLAALRAAAERGAQVSISVDWTIASHVGRFWEWTTTLLPAAEKLAEELPDRVRTTRRRQSDHSKYLLFRRPAAPSTALLGGINLGDRFRDWLDYMVRVEGDELVESLTRRVGGEGEPLNPLPLEPERVQFVSNVPSCGIFAVKTVYEALLGSEGLTHFRVAMAYVDRVGAEVLQHALRRGARVELILPEQANVYQQANLRTLRRLLKSSQGFLQVYFSPEMLHAKALLGYDEGGPRVAFLGSANLRRHSLRTFGELNALITESSFVGEFTQALEQLLARSERVLDPPRYRFAQAWVEERLG